MPNRLSGRLPRRLIVVLALAAFAAFAGPALFSSTRALTAAAPQSGYHLLKKIEIGGEGGWDYLTFDSGARRLYVSRQNRVIVIDTDAGKVVGEIPNTNGVHGIAIAADVGKGFTSNGRDNTATVFDLNTLKVLGEAKTGLNPDAIIYDPSSHRAFTFNGSGKSATAIDAKTGEVAGTVNLDGRPEFAAADGKGMVYVNLEDKNAVLAFDAKSLAIKGTWPIAPGERPTGLSIDPKNMRLFIGCGNKKMVVMDAKSGKVVTDLPIGSGVDATAFDPNAALAFSSNGEGTLTVVHEDSPDKFTVVENATTQRGARTMAVDPKTHMVFLATAAFEPAPAPTTENPRPRPKMIPNSFVILVFGN